MLDDISNRKDTNWFDYLTTRNGNQGNFLYNTRSNDDLIINVCEENE